MLQTANVLKVFGKHKFNIVEDVWFEYADSDKKIQYFVKRKSSAYWLSWNHRRYCKKFDIGIDLLDGIKTDTGEMKGTLNKINETLGDFVTEQRAHNRRLEKILEKLAER
ncbi:MAG: hypothetical protein EPN24_04545 [Candidatus Methanoperedens sp.]|nr:MAG: hypothetical protein EPN24_04545 [Candidatus Methanoperedens sp.]